MPTEKQTRVTDGHWEEMMRRLLPGEPVDDPDRVARFKWLPVTLLATLQQAVEAVARQQQELKQADRWDKRDVFVLLAHLERKLDEAREAVRLYLKGDWGICASEGCRVPISLARMLATKGRAVYCVPCQKEREQKARRMKAIKGGR